MNDLKKEFYEDFVNGEEVIRFLPERFVKWIESKIKEETEKAYEKGFKDLANRLSAWLDESSDYGIAEGKLFDRYTKVDKAKMWGQYKKEFLEGNLVD